MKLPIVRLLLTVPFFVCFASIATADDFQCIMYIAGNDANGAPTLNLRFAEQILFDGSLSSEEKLLPQSGGMVLPKAAQGFPQLPLFKVESGPNASVVVTDEKSGKTNANQGTAMIDVFVPLNQKTLVFGCRR